METIDEGELIGGAIESFARELRVALPGRIQSYDAQKQRASIELQLSYYVPTTDGGQVARTHTVLQNVPICFPQGGGFFCSFPMAKGDPVTVVFNDVPLGAWLSKGQVCEPGVDDMHGLGGAVAFPAGPQPSNTPIQNADANNLAIGSDSNGSARVIMKPSGEIDAGADASDYVAMASKTKAWFDAFDAAINAWIVAPNDGGGALKTALATLVGRPTDVASTNLKAETGAT